MVEVLQFTPIFLGLPAAALRAAGGAPGKTPAGPPRAGLIFTGFVHGLRFAPAFPMASVSSPGSAPGMEV